jgi:hypothetical protein
MESDRAKAIIRSLADGINPQTGIAFPPDSPYQQADNSQEPDDGPFPF